MEVKIPLVTFLIPTRKRLHMLKACLESLEMTCLKLDSFEVVVIFDVDDIETIKAFSDLNFRCTVKTIISERHGYYGLHRYINDAYTASSGEWFWLWNDDLRMISTGWDEVIREYSGKFVVLNPSNLHPYWKGYCMDATISPLVPKKWFELLKRFSAYSQYDTYINPIGYRLNLVINEPRLINIHEQVLDEVSAGISYDKNQFPTAESNLDYSILKDYLGKKQLRFNWFKRIPYNMGRSLRRRKKHFKRMLNIEYLRSRLRPRNILSKLSQFFKD